MKRFLGLFFLILLLAFRPVSAGDIIPDGLGHYGVVLDVLFTYEPEDENLEHWKSVFKVANKEMSPPYQQIPILTYW